MPAVPKNPPLRDRAWLDHLQMERCAITGQFGTATETVEAMHLGAYKGMKRGDDQVIPVLHHFHAEAHQSLGEAEMLRKYAPASLILEAFRALARENYRRWKEGR